MSARTAARAAFVLAALSIVPPAGHPQIVPYATPHPGVGRRALDPVNPVTLEDVALGRHTREVVKVKGQLLRLGMDERYRELREGTARVLVIVVPELSRDLRTFLGRRVEVVGFVRELVDEQGTCRFLGEAVPSSFCLDSDMPPTPDLEGRIDWPRVSITIWSVVEDFDWEGARRRGEGASRLGDLLAAGDDTRDVVVVGRFCGAGLCGRPASAPPEARAWLLQDGDTSVWVVGREAKGSGWRLDPAYAGDSARWLEVTGRLGRCGPVACLRARKVALAAPPAGEPAPVPR